jgi:hypothetical protein
MMHGRAFRFRPLARVCALLPWGLLALLGGPAAATAQTVVATNAPRGTTVEVALNGTPIGSAVVDPDGVATIPMDKAAGLEPEMDVLVVVDVCGEVRRVHVVRTGLLPPPRDAECARREIPGVFVLRPASTLVLNMAGLVPRLFLIQGPFDPLAPPPPRARAPRGLVLSGGTGLTRVRDAAVVFCGNVPNCEADGSGLGYGVGGTYWVRQIFGAEVTYLRPATATGAGGGDTYRFESTFEAEVTTLAGVVGIPTGPVRIYAKGGANYHRALYTTTQTVDDRPITVDGVVVGTALGGTQTVQSRTIGWGWLVGGGIEGWVRGPVGLYGEFTLAGLRGPDERLSEVETRDRLTMLIAGVRVRIGRW